MASWKRTRGDTESDSTTLRQTRLKRELAEKQRLAKAAADRKKAAEDRKAAMRLKINAKPAIKQTNAKPTRADALAAIAQQGVAEKKRAEWIKSMQNKPPFTGKVLIAGKTYAIKEGNLDFGGAHYQVSKDGRTVINNNLLIVGEIRGGVLNKPSKEFLNDMKFLGEVH